MNPYINFEFSDKPWYLIPFKEIFGDEEPLEINLDWYGKYKWVEDGVYIYSRVFVTALKVLTNLTEEDWYKKYILNIPLTQEVKCAYCGKPLKFISISKGYTNHGGRGYNHVWYCNQSCANSANAESESFQLNSVDSQAKGRFTQWMNQGNLDDKCEFYFGLKSDGTYKFGVAECSSNRGSWGTSELISIHKVISNTRLFVGSLEKDLKYYLNQNHESFTKDQFKSIKDFIRSYKI